MNECPSGCGRKVGSGKLMCGPCWGEVPGTLQRAVYRTWRAYQRALGARTDGDARENSLPSARAAYQQARDEAIGSIR